MLRLAEQRVFVSSSLPNNMAMMTIFPYNSKNNHWASLNSTSNSPVAPSDTDHQKLFRVLEACKLSSNLRIAIETHTRIIKLGYGTCSSLVSSLISIYASCGRLNLAGQLLNETQCWSLDLISANSIIASFMKIGEIGIAKRVFHQMPALDVVSWNSMIGGYVKNSHFREAFSILQEMLSSNVEPDGYTFSSVITACARLGALDHAKWIHGLMIEKKIELNYILCSALIDMYSKCGRIESAKEIFDRIQSRHVSVWNAMINGLAVHGLALDAIALFSLMESQNISPDSITFMGILTACRHCGLVDQGRKYFDLMRRHYSIYPQLEHYGSIVDLLGRAGCLEEAYAIIKEMPMDPDVVIWRALLSACKTHKNSKLGEVAITNISNLKSGDYVLLSNIYCSISKWDSAERVRYMMKRKGIRKISGCSWIELAGVVHQFKAGDISHPDTKDLYKVLEGLIRRTKIEGFIPTTELVLMDVSEEEKEGNLNYHSEKLALAYGILKTCPGIEIRISKNLRTCADCHCWMEMVSKLLNRVIIMRDRIRFHRFEGGFCSCGDYW
ncbi:pentatricopeptide repeat-containing protein At5g50990 [Cornus florida]|uniref:pentatricopeptide repeat-containing protein At5g50990 n=1 Tax=Cornus florida TaxID=4283 RepID=UPI0028A15A68|nr:pentatricopeptide repeat-containing protein At5g50990 [Cornus florida]XP_059642792.1 pentatricopeptide repeat-containing protein At5g50990 [Cornus florida]